MLLVLALLAAAAVYAPTLGRGLVNYDDPWLVHDNWIVQHASWSSLHTIFFDLDSPRRYALTPEYLPVRDLSVMLDYAVWGDAYAGFHATNLVVYLAAIALWFAALDRFGIERTIAGLAVLLWALHPSHAESVAWISERKGLLAAMFAGACALSYAQFRAGRSARWLVLAMLAAVAAVWSKAPAAFAIASLAGLEVVLPTRRVSWRRSFAGLGAIAMVATAAFVPVVLLAIRWSVIGTEAHGFPVGRLAMVAGVHGFDLRLAAMTIANAVSYPILTSGPTAADIAIGVLGLVTIVAVAILPRRGRWQPPPELRAAAMLWLFGWLPASHAIVPLQMVFAADRYLLMPTLGLALAIAVGVWRIANRRARLALIATIVLASGLRTVDAQASWRDAQTLWERAVHSNSDDGNAWSNYVEALDDAGRFDLAEAAVETGLTHTRSARLVMHEGLIVLKTGDRARGLALMRDAASGGDPRAMANLAVFLLDDGNLDDALAWARRATVASPTYVNGFRILGKVALAAGRLDEALAAFTHAYAWEPDQRANRFNLALALIALHRAAEARPHLEACATDLRFSAPARARCSRRYRPDSRASTADRDEEAAVITGDRQIGEPVLGPPDHSTDDAGTRSTAATGVITRMPRVATHSSSGGR